METISSYSDKKEIWGKMFLCESKKFGVTLLLCIKYPAKSWFDKTCFVQLNNEWNNVLFWDSVKDDKIISAYDNIKNIHSANVMLNTYEKKSEKS